MSRPVLVCQGFQRAFIDAGHPLFSVSASLRRGVCEDILKHARASGWTLVHSYLGSSVLKGDAARTIDGFTPLPSESYYWQMSLSAYRAPGFEAKLTAAIDAPVFLISLAGLGAIAATFTDALEIHSPMHVVVDAVADIAREGASESESLGAIDTLARCYDRRVESADLLTVAPLVPASLPGQLPASPPQ